MSDDDSSSEQEIQTYFVLSIDGGGFRGLACLHVLAYLMKEIGRKDDDDDDDNSVPRPCQVFDLICGTSTGGLIAILLGRFGLSCDEAIEVYNEIGKTMFDGKADAGKIWGNIIHGEQFSSTLFEKKLEEVIARYTGDKKALFKPSKVVPDTKSHENTRTFVTVVSKIGSAGVDPYRIRSYRCPVGDIDPAPHKHKWTIYEGARATCAAPMYLSPLRIQKNQSMYVFQDAGFSGFNNPATPALDEAEKVFGMDADIKLLSLGTGLRSLMGDGQPKPGAAIKDEDVTNMMRKILDSVTDTIKNVQNAPQFVKRIAKQLLEVATDTEITHLHTAEQFGREDRRRDYYRLNPPRGLGDINLTDSKQEVAIISLTDIWLKSPEGKKAVSSLVRDLKEHHQNKSSADE